MGRAELAPVSGEHSLADLEQFVDLAALEQLGLDRPYTVDDLLKTPESSKDFIEAGSKALESLAYQLKNDEEYKVKLPEYPTSYSEGVSTYGLEVLLRIFTPRHSGEAEVIAGAVAAQHAMYWIQLSGHAAPASLTVEVYVDSTTWTSWLQW